MWRFAEVKAERIAQLALDMNAASAEIVKEWVSVAEPNSMSRADLEVNAQRLARALLERKVGKVVILSCRVRLRDPPPCEPARVG